MSTCSRYCLDDVHKASGGDLTSRPGEWLRYDQAENLIADLNAGKHAFGSLRSIVRLADRSVIQLPPMGEVKNAKVRRYSSTCSRVSRVSGIRSSQLLSYRQSSRLSWWIAGSNWKYASSLLNRLSGRSRFGRSYLNEQNKSLPCLNLPRREVDIRLTRERISAKEPLSG
jgi:hypothetical protein